MKRFTVLFWFLGLSTTVSAQGPVSPQAVAPNLEAMKKLDFLIEQWKGEGWASFGPGPRHAFKQTEAIHSKLGGLLLVVEGLGKSKDPGNEGAIVHNAFAVASYDDKTKQIRWRAYTADGRYVDTELKAVQDRVLQWSIGQNVRFTMNLSEKDKWGEMASSLKMGRTG